MEEEDLLEAMELLDYGDEVGAPFRIPRFGLMRGRRRFTPVRRSRGVPVRRVVRRRDPVKAQGIRVKPKSANPKRELVLPFRAPAVTPAGQTETLPIAPQTLFMPTYIRFSAATAPFFVIQSVTIGRAQQFSAPGGGLAADTISGDEGLSVEWDTASVNQPIIITYTNVDANPQQFALVMKGYSVG